MSNPAFDPPPIACSLGAGDFQARLAWIAGLNARALRCHRQDDLLLHLTYVPEAADDVRELVANEQACCAFLTFETRQDSAGLHLTISAPEAARDAAEFLFEPFTAKTPAASSPCGCCSGAAA